MPYQTIKGAFMGKNDMDRSKYDRADKEDSLFKTKAGISESIVREISRQKNEPKWMLEKRLKALKFFNKKPMPIFGPDLSKLDLSKIHYFIRPRAKEEKRWEDVPENIRMTFEKIGIPEAERRALAGAGAQYDSSMIYHNIKKEWEKKGVIFENMDTAVIKYPSMIKKYFMTECVPINDHKFSMLHAAVWSGGTFIYVPKGVKVGMPLQAYFRMNAEKGGQFEHTLIIAEKGSDVQYIEGCSAPRFESNALHAGCVELFVREEAKIRYSSVENWSKNTYNLNTKRAIVDKNGAIEWVNSNFGSGCTMLYPCSVLKGKGARSDSLGIAFAGHDQKQDTGAKAIHLASNTTSIIKAKSICKDGGVSSYRGLVVVGKNLKNIKSNISCNALLLDNISKSNTYPLMKIKSNKAEIAHEARVGKIGEEEIFYLMSRGLTEGQAIRLIVSGFADDVIRKLPLEYAVELNRLIEMEVSNG